MENLLNNLAFHADLFLIHLYRMTGHPFLNFLLGTFFLSLICIVIGELSVSIAFRLNRHHTAGLTEEMTTKERLSMEAYQAGDKKGYQALNRQATEAWGKRFFTMIALSAGMLWPIPFALGWMQTRFADVDFPLPLVDKTVGYPFVFIPLYILSRILFGKARPYLPYFRRIGEMQRDPHVHPKAL